MPEPAVITLSTDFGGDSPFVGVMKGVILSRSAGVQMVDLFHDNPPGDILGAAFRLGATWRYFPPGTVHVVVIDPGVGTSRRILAAQVEGHFFTAPDNGVLSFLDQGRLTEIVSVEDQTYFLPDGSSTFHGRDRFAPVGAYLAEGGALQNLGPVCTDPIRLDINARKEKNRVTGTVVWIDRFGNLITSIRAEDVKTRNPVFKIREKTLKGLFPTFAALGDGCGAVIGSSGTVELVVNGASASQVLGARTGDEVVLYLDR